MPIFGGTNYGGSVSASNSKIKSDYASVNEQSGILAGDGGFQVAVNGNTDLQGAVLASTAPAIQANRNSLTTETLTDSDIQNKANYEGKSSSFTAGVGRNTDSQGNIHNSPSASAGMASDSDHASSVTQSAIIDHTYCLLRHFQCAPTVFVIHVIKLMFPTITLRNHHGYTAPNFSRAH